MDRCRHQDERFNSISHMLGAVAAMAGLVVLVVLAARQGDPWKIVSFSIYGASLVLLYSASALYHAFPAQPLLRKLDHDAIYLLIAGTYTPFTLVTLHGVWGWSIFGAVWGLAALGIVIDTAIKDGRRWLPVVIYLVMGWLGLVALKPLLRALPAHGFIGLLAGGLFYTVGVVFYALDARRRYFHEIWHLFVLAGSVTHFFTVLFYVD